VNLIPRVVRIGIVAALGVAAAGWIFERVRFGESDQTAVARVEAELRQRIAESARALQQTATQLAAAGDATRIDPRDQVQARRLFDLVGAAVPDEARTRTGVTLYDASAAPVAWAGRVSDLPKARIQGPRALFVAPGALGPRLIHAEPVVEYSLTFEDWVKHWEKPQELRQSEEEAKLERSFVNTRSAVIEVDRLGVIQ